ncbi:hypothetical protein EBQ74_11425 [bacterium]|nr:hypothetical protein [bacterium]
MVSKSILLRILLVFLSNYSCFSWGDNTATERGSHRGQTELVSPVERIGTVEARPIQEVCPDDEKEFDPKLVDFRGKKIRLGEAEGKRPTLVIIASADSKDRVLKFLAEFAKPVGRSEERVVFTSRSKTIRGLLSTMHGVKGLEMLGKNLRPRWENWMI